MIDKMTSKRRHSIGGRPPHDSLNQRSAIRANQKEQAMLQRQLKIIARNHDRQQYEHFKDCQLNRDFNEKLTLDSSTPRGRRNSLVENGKVVREKTDVNRPSSPVKSQGGSLPTPRRKLSNASELPLMNPARRYSLTGLATPRRRSVHMHCAVSERGS